MRLDSFSIFEMKHRHIILFYTVRLINVRYYSANKLYDKTNKSIREFEKKKLEY